MRVILHKVCKWLRLSDIHFRAGGNFISACIRLCSTKFGVGTWNIQNAWYCEHGIVSNLRKCKHTKTNLINTTNIQAVSQLNVATMVNQNWQKQSNEPLKNQKKYILLEKKNKSCVNNTPVFYIFFLWLADKVAEVFGCSTTKLTATASYFWHWSKC